MLPGLSPVIEGRVRVTSFLRFLHSVKVVLPAPSFFFFKVFYWRDSLKLAKQCPDGALLHFHCFYPESLSHCLLFVFVISNKFPEINNEYHCQFLLKKFLRLSTRISKYSSNYNSYSSTHSLPSRQPPQSTQSTKALLAG